MDKIRSPRFPYHKNLKPQVNSTHFTTHNPFATTIPNMARRRVKKRTHVGARNGAPNGGGNPLDRSPKSMVIRIGAGEVGASVSQLVKDMRHVMEPGTASRLKVSFPKKPHSHLYLLCPY